LAADQFNHVDVRRYSQDELIMPVRYALAIIPHPDLLTGAVSISAAVVQTF
jgi:hypothetical protein